MINYTLIAGFSIMLASLTGVLFAWKAFGTFFEKRATLLTSLAMGVFAVVIYGLFSEAHEEGLKLTELFLWGLSGAVFLEMISRIIPNAHHHHDVKHKAHDHNKLDAKRLLLGDALHNIGDGIILVPAFLIDVRFGIATTIGIILHESVQEVAEFFILKKAGYSTRRALMYNFLVSSTIFVGVALSLLFAFSEENIGVILSIAAGGFIYVLLRDLLPDTLHVMHCRKSYLPYIFSTIVGILLMWAVNTAIPHSHGPHDSHDHGAHEHHDDHKEDKHDHESHAEEHDDHSEEHHDEDHSDHEDHAGHDHN